MLTTKHRTWFVYIFIDSQVSKTTDGVAYTHFVTQTCNQSWLISSFIHIRYFCSCYKSSLREKKKHSEVWVSKPLEQDILPMEMKQNPHWPSSVGIFPQSRRVIWVGPHFLVTMHSSCVCSFVSPHLLMAPGLSQRSTDISSLSHSRPPYFRDQSLSTVQTPTCPGSIRNHSKDSYGTLSTMFNWCFVGRSVGLWWLCLPQPLTNLHQHKLKLYLPSDTEC